MTEQDKLPGFDGGTDVETIPEGKVKCVITDELRDDTPEEKVRKRIARSLVEEYGYSKSDIGIEESIKMGRKTKYADLIVYFEGKQQVQGNAKIVVEAKPEDIKPSNEDNGVNQLESYIAACMNVEFGLWVGSERLAFRVEEEGETKTLVDIPDIPRSGDHTVPKPTRGDLTPAVNLKEVFSRVHNYIYANQGLQKDRAFEELLKLIFIKVYDEQFSTSLQFYALPDEDVAVVRERLTQLFEKVKSKYEYIFDHKDQIELNDSVLRYVVSELQRFTFVETATDIKGEAYEELVGPNLRGDRGEFFTPRNVCNMMIKMTFSLFSEERTTSPGDIKILDPAVGTGGFLISAIQDVKQDYHSRGWRSDQVRDAVRDVANQNLYGIDFNPFLVKVAQMNMVMHGDGSSNIVQANSLEQPTEWNDLAGDTIGLGEFDLVITNPPFGSNAVIDNRDILNQFELTTYDAASPRDSLPPEQLFVERALDFLKPGGIMGIVLPDSILSNPGMEWIRGWLLEQAEIIASVDLPEETFEPHTGTQTSVLILKKKDTANQQLDDYEIFMSTPDAVGHDKRGNPVYQKTPEGDVKVDDNGDPLVDDDLPLVAKEFRHWIQEKGMR